MSQPPTEIPTHPPFQAMQTAPMPDPAMPPPAPVGRRKVGLILAALAVVFFLAAGAMTMVFFLNKSASDATIADQKAQIEKLRAEAAEQQELVAKLGADITKLSRDLNTAQAEVGRRNLCMDVVEDFFQAVKDKNERLGSAAVHAMRLYCEVIVT